MSLTPITGQATFTAFNLGNGVVEFTFDWVQRDEHKALVGSSIEYKNITFNEAKVRPGICGKDRFNVMFDSTGNMMGFRDEGKYAAIVTWIPKDSTKNPFINAVVLADSFNLAAAQHQARKKERKVEQVKQVPVGVFAVKCKGHEKHGFLIDIMRHFTDIWVEDPTTDLKEDGLWKQRVGTTYLPLPECPNLPPVNKMMLDIAKRRRELQEA